LDKDIRNLSGATLSCQHVTEGIRRNLALYHVALAGN
ncbi:MAG TPA: FMN-binding protein, partial [Candidatus Binatia bacterium]|nr:FMN-binding protein [Candidatus Binatia bacterium]